MIAVILTPIIILIAVLINRNMQRIDVEPNSPIIDTTTRTQFTDGYSLGIVKNQVPNKNGTTRIEMYPFDWVQGWNKVRPKLQRLIVGNGFLQRYARGDRSAYRERIDIAPRSKIDLPEKMRETDIGKDLTVKGQLAHVVKTVGARFITGGDQAIRNLLSITGNRGEMSSDAIAQLKQENSKFKETFKFERNVPEEEKKK